ncbi:Bgt-55020 [Blumeria graminis f. sp. tritici]|uniref:Bgt-55020 n=1 Tax=Blumeria graminis f. sp. tritici TaxID=62690 RepID=A0A9X9MK61_BLUGR|nr:Bgt-55020 [Blumeria graminis f. sp. tritici]
MEDAVVCLLVVFSGIVRVACAPTSLGKESPKTIFRSEES